LTTPLATSSTVTPAARLAVAAVLAFSAWAACATDGAAPSAPVQTARSHAGTASGGVGWTLPAGGANWNELTPAQHQVLAPLATEWNGLDSTGKEKWLEVSNRFPRMTPDEQARVRARMVEWVRMSPQERSRARLVFQENRDVSKEQRQALWQQYQALPDDKKKELAQKEIARRAPPASAATTGASSPHPRATRDIGTVSPKSNVVRNANPATESARPVAPVVVQARPGATTTLVNKTPAPPSHQKEGESKIAVGESEVDRTTLLPRKVPRPAGVGSVPVSAVPHARSASMPMPPVAPVMPAASATSAPVAATSHP
jgi:hypothetical protein